MESEVISGKSQTEALMYVSTSRPRSDFPVMTKMDKVNKLFIIWPFHY